MIYHPTSGASRTPDDSVPPSTPNGDSRQLVPAAIVPAALHERSAAWHFRPDDQRDLLLTTKLAIPPLRVHTLARPRLTNLLDQGLARKLTLVAAPAGYGKTSLLAAWLRQELRIENAEWRKSSDTDHSQFSILNSQFKAAWVTLDPTDTDPQHFWTYVIVALDALSPGLGVPVLDLLWTVQPIPIETLLTMLL